MKGSIAVILFLSLLLLQGCWEEDLPVPPYVPDEDVVSIALENSIYTHQVYVDLEIGQVVAEMENSVWQLAFECGDEGRHVRVNTGDYWAVVRCGVARFDSVYALEGDELWWSDKSDGNLDSTAFGDWNAGEVFLLGKFDGIRYNLGYKVQLHEVTDSSYKLSMLNAAALEVDTIVVKKMEALNYVHLSGETKVGMQLEPPKDEWDLLFSQYHTILYTDDSVRTDYTVRGVLLNPNGHQAMLDTVNTFRNIGYETALGASYSGAEDAIGHDWKSVKVDAASNSAEYRVRDGYSYIIQEKEGRYYKLRFTSYFSAMGIKGHPRFEYVKLEEK